MTQRTLVLLKPDAVRRGLVGEVIGRIERKAGWQITALELRQLDRAPWSSTTPSTSAGRLRAARRVHAVRSGRRARRRR